MLKLAVAVLLSCLAFLSFADEYVNGYFRNDGTYVQGYFKSTPNTTNRDNYSTQGNLNPYTGNVGTRAPDYSPQAYNYGDGRIIYTGPKGGQYYINDSGKKVYLPKRW